MEEEKKLECQQTEIGQRIDDYQEAAKQAKLANAMDADDLDDFMKGLSKDKATVDKTSIRKYRVSVKHFDDNHQFFRNTVFNRHFSCVVSLQYDLQQVKTSLAKVKRLINIARPADLPPLKRVDTAEPGTKKKFELPLFGKKRTFGLGNPKATTTSATKQSDSNTQNTPAEQTDFVEEFDDDDEGPPRSNDDNSPNKIAECGKAQNNNLSSSSKDTDNEQKKTQRRQHVDIDETVPVNSTIDVPETKQPASMTTASIESDSITSAAREAIDEQQSDDTRLPERTQTERVRTNDKEADKPANQISHKSRHRNRQRGQKRAHIDVDEAEEELSPTKFADWIPPENQSGDGITDLNSKFGY